MKIVVMEGCFGNTLNVDGKHEDSLTVEELRATLHLAVDSVVDREDLVRMLTESCLNHLAGQCDAGDPHWCEQCGSYQTTVTFEV